jgi:CheY-like chemotaxis protein
MAQRILVVDDDPLMHWVTQRYLERAGFEMLSAKNGIEALDLAHRERPQLIILDVRMTEMDGLAVLRKLKESEATRSIPVIMVTVSSDHLTKLKSESSGAAGFVTKPFQPAQLLAEIRSLIPEPNDSAGKR